MRLYHAATSYYSMIARLALVEAGIAFEPVKMDIHRKKMQPAPDYARINPNMTVPTLIDGDAVITESRAIALRAFGTTGERLDAKARAWLDRHYAFPIEELTFGSLLSRNPLMRWIVPRQLARTEKQLRELAAAHADLAPIYSARADVFARRRRVFDPREIAATYAKRRAEALAFLDALDAELADGREFLVPPAYGVADVVWTVFLARICFIKQRAEIDRRPALQRYAAAMFARPSFAAADVWTRLDVFKMLRA